jgi:hypothetical protein
MNPSKKSLLQVCTGGKAISTVAVANIWTETPGCAIEAPIGSMPRGRPMSSQSEIV